MAKASHAAQRCIQGLPLIFQKTGFLTDEHASISIYSDECKKNPPIVRGAVHRESTPQFDVYSTAGLSPGRPGKSSVQGE
jgi:hypothetical protein